MKIAEGKVKRIMDNTCESKVPEGYVEFAQSILPGTGGIRATAYHNTIDSEKWIFILLEDPIADKDKKVNVIGPLLLRTITTLNHIIGDIMFINRIN